MQHRAKKRFGQNFLQDSLLISRIIQSLNITTDDTVIEIGPGLGALTFPLLQAIDQLTVVEIDRDLIQTLKQKASKQPDKHLTIIESDVLKVDFSPLGKQLTVIGNLPYNISTPVLFHLLQYKQQIKQMCFMLQQEVVDRMAASPGSKTYGRLSVILQYHFKIVPLLKVPPDAFIPQPKVMSKVVRLTPHQDSPYEPVDPATFEKVVRMAFAHRRKTLKKNLGALIAAEKLEALGIDPTIRPETLTVSQYVTISLAISNKQP